LVSREGAKAKDVRARLSGLFFAPSSLRACRAEDAKEAAPTLEQKANVRLRAFA
jgi:hypothetical protein